MRNAKRSNFSNRFHLHKSRAAHVTALIAVIIATAVVFSFASEWVNDRPEIKTTYGVTFSTLYSDQLGLSYQDVYQSLVEEVGVKQVRLPVYWSEVEHNQGEFDWTRYDWLFEYSKEHGVSVVPVVGVKVPRWPECFSPDWAETMSEDAHHNAAMTFIRETVERYKSNDAIVRWQVENEPFFPFGICPEITTDQFLERAELVRHLDDRPIQITVSGEIGPWLDQAQEADVLGFSLYRQTWSDAFGYFVYPLSPEYYFIRTGLVSGYVDEVIISELQAEPWFPELIENRTPTQWYEVFTKEMLQENADFAQETGVSETYFWGAEWWYYLLKADEPRLWDKAITIFQTNE